MGLLEYFINEWVVDREGINHIRALFEKAEAIGCVVYLLDGKQDQHGYQIQSIVVQTTEHHMIDEFVAYATTIGFGTWKPCEPPPSGNLPTHIAKIPSNIYGAWIDGLDNRAYFNQKLRKKSAL